MPLPQEPPPHPCTRSRGCDHHRSHAAAASSTLNAEAVQFMLLTHVAAAEPLHVFCERGLQLWKAFVGCGGICRGAWARRPLKRQKSLFLEPLYSPARADPDQPGRGGARAEPPHALCINAARYAELRPQVASTHKHPLRNLCISPGPMPETSA